MPAVVKSIDQDAKGVTVTTAKGEKMTADYVIVTVPLGVLKAGSITFNPPLPAAKQTAIKDMVRLQWLLLAATVAVLQLSC